MTLAESLLEYEARFGLHLPYPLGVDEDYMMSVILEHLQTGKPIDPDFDWYPGLPPGALI